MRPPRCPPPQSASHATATGPPAPSPCLPPSLLYPLPPPEPPPHSHPPPPPLSSPCSLPSASPTPTPLCTPGAAPGAASSTLRPLMERSTTARDCAWGSPWCARGWPGGLLTRETTQDTACPGANLAAKAGGGGGRRRCQGRAGGRGGAGRGGATRCRPPSPGRTPPPAGPASQPPRSTPAAHRPPCPLPSSLAPAWVCPWRPQGADAEVHHGVPRGAAAGARETSEGRLRMVPSTLALTTCPAWNSCHGNCPCLCCDDTCQGPQGGVGQG